jgi:protein-L-isoaspartate(D-aspartate) O-methyltransferase
MHATQTAIGCGLVDPQFGWGAMATVDQNNLAYLAGRTREPVPEGHSRLELGIIGHGPGGDALVDHMVNAVQVWDRGYRSASADFEILPASPLTTAGTRIVGTFPLTEPPWWCAISTTLSQVIMRWR